MKQLSILSLLFLLITCTSTNCKKGLFEDKLPKATQTGENTCGFLVNGKVWTPKRGSLDELSFYYDPVYMNGEISLSGAKYETGNNTSFVVAINNISGTGNYKLNIGPNPIAKFNNSTNYCFRHWDDTIPNHNAFLNITKFDLQKGIISGTFEFALAKPGCETVRITQGRFDMNTKPKQSKIYSL